MKIDRIKKIKKNTNILYSFDERVAVLKDYELINFSISEDCDISDDVYEKIINEIEYPRAYEKAISILAIADKSTFEIKNKLITSGFPDIVIERVLDELVDKHYVDDRRYVENYIYSKSKTKSMNEIIYTLKTKGVDKSLLEEILEENEYSDEDAIEKILIKRMKNKNLEDKKEIQKIIAYACNKGFEYEKVKKVLIKILDEFQEIS